MHLVLDKRDLVNMIKGTSPPYELMEDPVIKQYGYYTGGFVDNWTWGRNALEGTPEEELYQVYLKIKQSQDKVYANFK